MVVLVVHLLGDGVNNGISGGTTAAVQVVKNTGGGIRMTVVEVLVLELQHRRRVDAVHGAGVAGAPTAAAVVVGVVVVVVVVSVEPDRESGEREKWEKKKWEDRNGVKVKVLVVSARLSTGGVSKVYYYFLTTFKAHLPALRHRLTGTTGTVASTADGVEVVQAAVAHRRGRSSGAVAVECSATASSSSSSTIFITALAGRP